jgi:rhodanese-related sulfurtransferase
MKKIKGLLVVSGMVLGLGGCAEPVKEASKPEVVVLVAKAPEKVEGKPDAPSVKMGEITAVDLNRLLQLQDDGKAYLIDVRPRLFYSLGHLPEAISMPKKSFPLSLMKRRAGIDVALSGGKVLVLYCQNAECPDGDWVGKEMAAMGYSVSIYEGGWEQWEEMGF